MSDTTSNDQQASDSSQQVVEPFEAAYNEYQRRAGEVTLAYKQQLYNAYIDYLKSVEIVRWSRDPDTIHQGLENAVNTYSEAMQTAQMDANHNAEDAYKAYVDELKKAWVNVDANSLDTFTLANIGQSMIGVVNRASGTQPIVYPLPVTR